ncbi:transposase [Aquirufa beregesia]
MNITDDKTADNKGSVDIPMQKGSVIVADRYYNDFNLLNTWDSHQVFFVIRHKQNLNYLTIKANKLLESPNYNHVVKLLDKTFKQHKQTSNLILHSD